MNNNTIVTETSPLVAAVITAIKAQGNGLPIVLAPEHPWYPNIAVPILRPAVEGVEPHRVDWCGAFYNSAGERVLLDDLDEDWWAGAQGGADLPRGVGHTARLHDDFIYVSSGFYVLTGTKSVDGKPVHEYVSEVWQREERERLGVEYLARNPEVARPGWAQTVDAVVEADGTVALTYEADFGHVSLSSSGVVEEGDCVKKSPVFMYVHEHETATSAEKLREMAVDFVNAASSLEKSEANDSPAPATKVVQTGARYTAQGEAVHDRVLDLVATFSVAEAARAAADWLNGPYGTASDYEWVDSDTANTAFVLDWCREARRALDAGSVVPAVPMRTPDWAETVDLRATKRSIEVTFKSRAFVADRMGAHLELTASIYSDDDFFPDGRLFAKAGSMLADGHPCVLVDGTVNQVDTLEETPEGLRNLASVLLDAANAMRSEVPAEAVEADAPMSASAAMGAQRLAGMMREGGFKNIGEMFTAQEAAK